MAITAGDLYIFESQTMTDDDLAGGPRGDTAIPDNVENNLFPDVSSTDRLTGRSRIRKVYPSVISAGNDTLYSAVLNADERPTDAAVQISLWVYGDDTTTRSDFEANGLPTVSVKISGEDISGTGPITYYYGTASYATGPGVFQLSIAGVVSRVNQIEAGSYVLVQSSYGTTVHQVTEINFTGSPYINVSPDLPEASATPTVTLTHLDISMPVQPYAAVPLSAAVVATDTVLPLTTFLVGIVPYNGVTYPSADLGVSPGTRAYSLGQFPLFVAGNIATLWHEDETTPATVAATDVINCGRTDLQQMALIGNDGLEIVRFLRDGPTPASAGCTPDLDAGTLTIDDPTGYSQPVHVKHRIAERVAVTDRLGLDVTITSGLSRDFGSGAILSGEAPLDDLSVAATNQFSQQAWTRVWSNSVIGTAISPLYLGTISVTSDGAETDRWACVFTSLTSYDLYSERRGLVGSGNVGTDYLPLNPATNEPFFTLYAGNWKTGAIAIGNTFRFNTQAAYRGVFALQCVAPSTASGTTRTVLRLRGSIDA